MNNVINFRDCGGFPAAGGKQVKTGMLFRSASLDRIRGRTRALIERNHFTTIIDLRPSQERSKHIALLPGVKRITIPLDIDRIARQRVLPYIFRRWGKQGVEMAITSVYHDMVTIGAPSVRILFSCVTAADAYPLCINCRAGKDRTGFAIALILRTLGVSDAAIIDDYLATNHYLLPRVRRVTVPLRWLSFTLFPAAAFEAALTARREYLTTAFSKIDTDFDGIDGYLDFCEVPVSWRNRLRKILL